MSNYSKMTDIEKKRQQADLMYHVIVNSKAETLNDICNQIKTFILKSYNEENISTRLKQILARITADLIPPGAEPRLHRAGTSAETDVDDLLPIPRANCIFHRLGADEVCDNTR